ncbi:MAG: Nramp family divalent metal transporter [Planctomycetota bacterium]
MSRPSNLPPLKSLDEVHRSVKIPANRPWRRLLAFTGPAYLVSVGYMDPGNWATDLEAGSKFGYRLIFVLLMANAMAVLLQTLSARLGLVTGRDLAQACHDDYPPVVNYILFVLCEIAIAACDLAEVLGTAIGLNLLTGIPLIWAVLITGGDVLLLLAMQHYGIRKMEALIFGLISLIGLCFVVEIFLSKPSPAGIISGFQPLWLSGSELLVAIGILGATVMPHNLYMHSSLVQSRDVTRSREAVAEACKYNFIDSAIAMNLAFLVNAAILIVAAATFWSRGQEISEIQDAHRMLSGILGTNIAPIAFALALICAGQSSTITGTLAGQITMEGFLRLRLRPWLRRMITRTLAIAPAVAVIYYWGDGKVMDLLILSQVVLSLQLAFAVIPLVKFTNSPQKMGPFVNRWWVQVLAWVVTAAIVSLNGKLVYEQVIEWAEQAGSYGWIVYSFAIPFVASLAVLLLWMTVRRERPVRDATEVSADDVASRAAKAKQFRRIGVALEALPSDSAMLAEAIALARMYQAELVLIHVVDGPGGRWYGPQTGDLESRHDEDYLKNLVERLRTELTSQGVPRIEAVLGFGSPPNEIANLAKQNGIDLMVLGGHGHSTLLDLLRGETISGVRHRLDIPVLAVR